MGSAAAVAAMIGKPCAKCGEEPRLPTHSYGRLCLNAAKRASRRKLGDYQRLSPEDRRKAIARATLRVYVERGKVTKPTTCEDCGHPGIVQALYLDYGDPFKVRWLCRGCHRVSRQCFMGNAPLS